MFDFKLFLLAMLVSSIANVAFAQPTPEREAELLRQYNAISPLVNAIVAEKVFPVFNDLRSDQAAPISQADIETLLKAIDLSSTIQIELSGSFSREPVQSHPEYRTVYRYIAFRGILGRCRYRRVAVCEPVPEKSAEEPALSRQPLTDAIEKMRLYLGGRDAQEPGGIEEDRAAAFQTLSILQIVNPAYKAGQIVQ